MRPNSKALSTTFELLSTRFGIHQAEVVDVAAAWAALGSAGAGLARSVRATIETSILGDVELEEATTALIATQQQWGFSTMEVAGQASELTVAMAELNMVENVTAATTSDLLEVQSRAAGVARTAGMSFRELLAMTASLVPAAGGAAQAGTALRSIISSFQAPTAQAIEAFGLMGIKVASPEWMGKSVTQKLEAVAQGFEGLTGPQQNVVSATIGTRWQVSRLDILIRDILDPLGNYQKAMAATADTTKVLAARDKELLAVLQSEPKAWDIMVNATRNAMTKAFIPMIPAIMSIVRLVTELATAFSNLDPKIQTFILAGLALLAVLGPIVVMLGSTMQLVGLLGGAFKGLGETIFKVSKKFLWPLVKLLSIISWAMIRTAATALVSFLTAIGPIGWIIIGVIAAIAAAVVIILKTDLEDKVWDVIVSIGRAFSELPRVIGEALIAVLKVIGQVMTGIVEALSYLNPFARHSPSLVDNVRDGVSTILDEYSRFRAIPGMVAGAAAALEAFSTATSSTGQSAREIELRKKANVEGASPAQAGAANSMVTNIVALERQLPGLEQAINAQETVVNQWTRALKEADRQIELMERSLNDLEEAYDAIGDQIAAANDRISELADTPLAGMGALEDEIFANQHAQNLLNMELLEFERQGISIDNIKDKYAAMAGEIETLRGTQEDLRTAGAGSDVLGWYDDQIAAIEAQKNEMSGVERHDPGHRGPTGRVGSGGAVPGVDEGDQLRSVGAADRADCQSSHRDAVR